MFTINKSLLASALLILTITNLSIANDASPDAAKASAAEGSLKLVMQGLLNDTQQLTAAMLNEDFVLIEVLAKNIADHPKPSMATRMKLMKAMGSDMAKFKAHDGVVHGAAVNMIKSAQGNNIKAVGEKFQTMIGGCLACHSEFKERVTAILK